MDKDQFSLKDELVERLNWYREIKEKTFKQVKIAPKAARSHMMKLVDFIEDTAIPTVRRLLATVGEWSRDAAVEFYNANQEVCRLTREVEDMIRSG
jgi:hypothetical protein